jgi:hypothetical protein
MQMSAPISRPLRHCLYLAVALAVLATLALISFGKVGSLYDYSIIINSSYAMERGLVAHRDFSTALLHLPTLIARVSEIILGAKYLSLVWANLILSLLFLAWAFPNTRRLLPEAISVFLVTTFAAATSLQHGIVWYNTIAAFLLYALVISTLNLVTTRGRLLRRDVIGVIAFSLLLGMTKLNFFVVGVAIVATLFSLKLLGADATTRWSYLKLALLGYIPLGILLGPLLDLLLSGANYHVWIQDVVIRPGSRGGILRGLLEHPERIHDFFFGISHDCYPKSPSSGVVAIFAGVYFLLLVLPAWNPTLLIRRLLVLALFFVATSLLILSNYEIQILTASFFLLGIVASRNVARFESSAFVDTDKRKVGDELLIMSCLYCFTVAAMSIVNHSRLAFEPWNEPLVVIDSNTGPNYLTGVKMTPDEYYKVAPISHFMQELKSRNASSSSGNSKPAIFFGPGLEYNYRAYDIEPPRGMPLWFHHDTTWIKSDIPALLSAVEQCRFDYAVFFPYSVQLMPEELKEYFEKNFVKKATPMIEGVPDDRVTIWERTDK